MADPVDAVVAAADALAAAMDDTNTNGNNQPDAAISGDDNALKKRALELLTEDNEDDLDLEATTLDDVMVSPLLKKPRVDGEDAAEEDDDVAIGEEEDEQDEAEATGEEEMESDGERDDADALAPPDSSTDEEEERVKANTADVVTVDDEEEEEEEEDEDDGLGDFNIGDEDDEEDESSDVISPIQRRRMEQNKAEARQLISQLDSAKRSRLVITALEKYREDLFNGHESARDAILIDACGYDFMLGLLKDAVRESEMNLRGGTEDEPLELDDDEDDYEDDADEDEDIDSETNRIVDDEDDDDEDENGEVNLLSDDETDENAGSRPEDEENDEDDDDDEDAGTGGEQTVGSATGEEDDSVDELSS